MSLTKKTVFTVDNLNFVPSIISVFKILCVDMLRILKTSTLFYKFREAGYLCNLGLLRGKRPSSSQWPRYILSGARSLWSLYGRAPWYILGGPAPPCPSRRGPCCRPGTGRICLPSRPLRSLALWGTGWARFCSTSSSSVPELLFHVRVRLM